MKKITFLSLLVALALLLFPLYGSSSGLPLYYWKPTQGENFGDYLSLKLVERITHNNLRVYDPTTEEKKLLAIGSILHFANDSDVIWGSGINGKHPDAQDYHFKKLDVRAVRGPLTRQFLIEHFHITCPAIFGDPALLLPFFFPEFQRKKHPVYTHLIIPHCSEEKNFPKDAYSNVAYPTDPWDEVVEKILSSKFVISSSLHGIVVAEAFGIPARMLRISENEPLFKYKDYYHGTGRYFFRYATSVDEALKMGGEPPYLCDIKKLYQSFPFEFWETLYFDPNVVNRNLFNQ